MQAFSRSGQENNADSRSIVTSVAQNRTLRSSVLEALGQGAGNPEYRNQFVGRLQGVDLRSYVNSMPTDVRAESVLSMETGQLQEYLSMLSPQEQQSLETLLDAYAQ